MLPTLSMFSTRRNTTAFVTRFFTSSWLTDITQWPGKIQRRITSRSTVASRYHTRCHCAMMIRLFTIWHHLSTKLYVVNMNISRNNSLSLAKLIRFLVTEKHHMMVQDIPAANSNLGEVCELPSAEFGETAPECAEAYFYYGKALLEMARLEAGVLDNGLDGDG